MTNHSDGDKCEYRSFFFVHSMEDSWKSSHTFGEREKLLLFFCTFEGFQERIPRQQRTLNDGHGQTAVFGISISMKIDYRRRFEMNPKAKKRCGFCWSRRDPVRLPDARRRGRPVPREPQRHVERHVLAQVGGLPTPDRRRLQAQSAGRRLPTQRRGTAGRRRRRRRRRPARRPLPALPRPPQDSLVSIFFPPIPFHSFPLGWLWISSVYL